MLPLVASIPKDVTYSVILADFIEDLGKHVNPYNTSYIYLEKLEKMMSVVHAMELPKTREEFDEQSSLIELIKELEKYLILKSVYKGFSRGKKEWKIKKSTKLSKKLRGRFMRLLLTLFLVFTFTGPDKFEAAPINNQPFIIVNKANNKLAFIKDGKVMEIFNVATGKSTDLTPEGLFTFVVKAKNPYYRKKYSRWRS